MEYQHYINETTLKVTAKDPKDGSIKCDMPLPHQKWDKQTHSWVYDLQEQLETSKNKQIAELSASCEAEIIGGFQSDAHTTGAWYKSGRDDQLNIVGAKDTTIDLKWTQGIEADPINEPNVITWTDEVLHTPTQLQQIFSDGLTHKYTQFTKYKTLKAQVNLETTDTLAKIEAIVW